MKKRIMFLAYSDSNWMGGVYYVKNIVYQFLSYELTSREFDIYIFMDRKIKEIFSFCEKYDNVKFIFKRALNGNRLYNKIADMEIAMHIFLKKINYIYPDYNGKYIANPKMISWIPDFQHVYLKEFFSEEERKKRDEIFENIAKKHRKLILSSKDSYNAYCKLYPEMTKGVYIVPFVSAIDQADLTKENFEDILKKYDIRTKDFFLVSNQFWQHKNHICLIKAVEITKKKYGKEIMVICTGYKNDFRKNGYVEDLMCEIRERHVDNNIKILGLIPRTEQLKLMEKAIAVVQPSLFEGWGTVVEDAKTLGKITVLSDIEVHKEQQDERSILFDKNSPDELAEILKELWEKYAGKAKQFEYGVRGSENYGKMFYNVLASEGESVENL